MRRCRVSAVLATLMLFDVLALETAHSFLCRLVVTLPVQYGISSTVGASPSRRVTLSF